MIPNVVISRLDTGQEIPCGGLGLAIDADSHTWSARLTLLGKSALQAVTGSGPITLVAEINGNEWRLIVDQWSATVAFGRRAIVADCRGLNAQLSAPWQAETSGTNATGTIEQVLQALLPSPWAVQWSATEPAWTVPAGAWSWTDASPIGAAHIAAQGLGLVLVPSLDSEQITVQSRYPVPPWQYASASPDLVVPAAALTRYERRPARPGANAVIVHGGDTGGHLVSAQLTGTAGDILAATQSSPLLTNIDAGRALATAILSAQNPGSDWRQITLPLGGDFPLGKLGDLVEISAGPDTARDTVTAVQINVTGGDRPSVRQTLGLGEPNNPASRFRALIPGSPIHIAEVLAVYGQTSTVQLLAGQQIRVRGTASVGDKVYIENHRIAGPAPSLPAHQIQL